MQAINFHILRKKAFCSTCREKTLCIEKVWGEEGLCVVWSFAILLAPGFIVPVINKKNQENQEGQSLFYFKEHGEIPWSDEIPPVKLNPTKSFLVYCLLSCMYKGQGCKNRLSVSSLPREQNAMWNILGLAYLWQMMAFPPYLRSFTIFHLHAFSFCTLFFLGKSLFILAISIEGLSLSPFVSLKTSTSNLAGSFGIWIFEIGKEEASLRRPCSSERKEIMLWHLQDV